MIASATRQAALLLHAMPEADRQWLLGELPLADRQQLGELLAELQSLGIPRDRELLTEAIRLAPPSAGVATPACLGGHEALRRADAEALAALLRAEPPRLVARLLAIDDWPWREDVLKSLGTSFRQAVEDDGTRWQGVRAAALDATLISEILARLGSAPPTTEDAGPAPAGESGPSRWHALVRRWQNWRAGGRSS